MVEDGFSYIFESLSLIQRNERALKSRMTVIGSLDMNLVYYYISSFRCPV